MGVHKRVVNEGFVKRPIYGGKLRLEKLDSQQASWQKYIPNPH